MEIASDSLLSPDSLSQVLYLIYTRSFPLEERYQRAQDVAAAIRTWVQAGSLLLSRDDGETFSVISPNRRLFCGHDDLVVCAESRLEVPLSDALRYIDEVNLEMDTVRRIDSVDCERLARMRLQFGGKGAVLMEVQQHVLDSLLRDGDFRFQNLVGACAIPPFECVDTAVYRQWFCEGDVSVFFRELYDRWKGRPLIVRSSAVYSEDGECVTGSGIYASISLEADASFEQFFAAVTQVYQSCEAELARKYRTENGIMQQEAMGLIIQEWKKDVSLGYVNSTSPKTRDKTSLHHSSLRVPVILDSDRLDTLSFQQFIGGYKLLRGACYVSPDLGGDSPFYNFEGMQIVILSRLLERYFGHPVQVEFGLGTVYDSEFSTCGTAFSIFQARQLLPHMFDVPEIRFPLDKTIIASFAACGVCDRVLDVLDSDDDNGERSGLVIFAESYGASLGVNMHNILRALPREGVVVMLYSSVNGHIETLAIERGLTLLFDRDSSPVTLPDREVRQELMKVAAQVFKDDHLDGRTRVRVVANGEEGRIYASDIA